MIAALLGLVGSSALPWLAGLLGGLGILGATFFVGHRSAASTAKAVRAARDAEASAGIAAAEARMAHAQANAPEDTDALKAALEKGQA